MRKEEFEEEEVETDELKKLATMDVGRGGAVNSRSKLGRQETFQLGGVREAVASLMCLLSNCEHLPGHQQIVHHLIPLLCSSLLFSSMFIFFVLLCSCLRFSSLIFSLSPTGERGRCPASQARLVSSHRRSPRAHTTRNSLDQSCDTGHQGRLSLFAVSIAPPSQPCKPHSFRSSILVLHSREIVVLSPAGPSAQRPLHRHVLHQASKTTPLCFQSMVSRKCRLLLAK